MANPTVSVIIPCYNSEKTVGETLESLQKQTFRDWEAIVVNDGSTDSSAEIIRQYRAKDSRIRQIDQENQGLPGARNAGLAVAKGEFVNFLDADDLLLPNMLQRMVQKLGADASFGAVHCGSILTDPELQDLTWVTCPSIDGELLEHLAHYNPFPCHSVLLHRGILENLGLFDRSLKHCHDWDLWLRVARSGTRFACVSEPLVIYRMMPASLSRNPLTFFEAGREVIRRGHRPDPRVKKPAPEFTEGCSCSMKKAILEYLLHCVSFAIAKGDAVQASELLETKLVEEDLQISPSRMGGVINSLWFAVAIPEGNWQELWPRIGRPLLEFLLRQEERLESPGFAMECLLEMLNWYELKRRSNPEEMYGRELLSAMPKNLLALSKKVAKRFMPL